MWEPTSAAAATDIAGRHDADPSADAPTDEGQLRGWARFPVPGSLLVSFLANDGEELVTMADTYDATLARTPTWMSRHASGHAPSQAKVTVALTLMGSLVLAAVVNGWATAGRGRLFQNVQWAFGVHGWGHLAASAVTRGYTTGVATAPTVVLPQWWYARRTLSRHGVRDVSSTPGVLAVAGWLPACWLLAEAATARKGRGTRRTDRPTPER